MLSCSRALKIPILGELAQSDPLVGQNPSFFWCLVLVERLRGLFGYFTLSYSIPLFLSYGESSMLKECEHTWVGVKKMVVNTAMQYVYVEKMLGGVGGSWWEGECFCWDYYYDDFYFCFVLFCFVLFCFVLFCFSLLLHPSHHPPP